MLVARRADRLAAIGARIGRPAAAALAIAADVLDRAEMTRAFERGGGRAFGTVDMLVNNAGVAHGHRAVELGEAEWRRVVGTNLDAVIYSAQEAARRMLAANKGGAIVNIASVLGLGVSKGVAPYAVAKAGVIQMTKALALELTFKGIRVNAIAPGWIVTEMNHEYLGGESGAGDVKRNPGRPFRRDARPRRRVAAARLRRRPLHLRRNPRGRRRPGRWRSGAEVIRLHLPMRRRRCRARRRIPEIVRQHPHRHCHAEHQDLRRQGHEILQCRARAEPDAAPIRLRTAPRR